MKGTLNLWIGAFALLTVAGSLSLWIGKWIDDAVTWQVHTLHTINKAENLLSDFKDTETGQRGYLLTGDKRFLEPYLNAAPTINAELAELYTLTSDNSTQQQLLDVLKPLAAAKLAILKETIALQQNDRREAALALVKIGRGKELMDSIRREINRFIQEESLLSDQRGTRLALNIRYLTLSIASSAFLAIMMSGGAAYRIRHLGEVVRRKAAFQASLLNSTDLAIFSTAPEGVITSFNRGAEQLLGYRVEELQGKQTPAIFHDADEVAAHATELGQKAETNFETLVSMLRHGRRKQESHEWIYLSKGGARIPVQLSVSDMHDNTGAHIGFLFIAIDITRRKEAEERLKNSERFTRSVLDALSKQFCVLDAGGNILEVNKPWLDFEGEQDGDTQPLEAGQNYPALLSAGLAKNRGGEAFSDGICSVLNGTTSSFLLEYSSQTQSELQWFVGNVIPFPDQKLGSIIVTHENISKHKRLEHRFRQAVESAPNAVVMINESGMMVMVNAQTEASFGYPRTELLGEPLEKLVPERFRGGHAGFRQAYFATPQSRPMGAGRDLYGLRKDGTEFPVEIGLSLIENHEETLVLGTIVDITERNQAMATLKASESALKEAQHLAGLGSWKWDTLTGAHTWSEEINHILGRDPALPAVIYPDVGQYFTPDSWARLAAAVEQCLTDGVSYKCDAEVVRPDGTRRWIVASGEATRDAARNITDVHGTVQDITERKNTNIKLKNAFNEKEMLLKEVYHRVKNNLQVVSSLINLQAKHISNETTLGLLKQSADRIKAMALLHEKLYQSKDLTRIDFNEYIHSLVNYLLFGHGTHSGKIKISTEIDNVFLDVDTAIPCGLIINELLSNALEHAFPDDRHGEIGITFRQDQGEFILVISDNGIGFPASLDFKKTDSLGLQLVATLTDQLMGQMTLDQTDGATFSLRFSNTL